MVSGNPEWQKGYDQGFNASKEFREEAIEEMEMFKKKYADALDACRAITEWHLGIWGGPQNKDIEKGIEMCLAVVEKDNK